MTGRYLNNVEVAVSVFNYVDNNRKAIRIFDVEDGLPYASATVNVPNLELEEDEVVVKNYAENEGMLDFLLNENIVKDTGKTIQQGYVTLNVCKLLPESEWKSKTQKNENKPTYYTES
jgi:hypothetical protein